MVRTRLSLALLLFCAPAWAQLQYSPTPGSGYRALDGATVKGPVNVRAQNATPPVVFTLDGVTVHTENSCPCDLYGDPNLWDTTRVADGRHVLRAGSYTATFMVSNAAVAPTPPQSPQLVDWTVSWFGVTTDTAGNPLSGVTYRLESSPVLSGPWSSIWQGSTTSTVVGQQPESVCFRVFALSSQAESEPGDAKCFAKVSSPPSVPPPAGDPRKALSLVAGASSGTRAVYARSATGSRGAKLGDLAVGPGGIADYQRVECSTEDAFTYGGTRYARVTDPAAPEALRAGYVSGCASVGLH